jgi:hypothetical protein
MVSCELEGGDGRRIAGCLQSLTPSIWDEGLAEPALDAARRASARGVRDAAAALADLERSGGRCRVARALVRLLAAELTRGARADAARWSAVGRRPEGMVPELN